MKKFSCWIEYIVYISIAWFLNLIPFSLSLKAGEILGNLLFLFDRKHREITLTNLGRAFKNGKSEKEIFEIGKACYRNIGRSFVEFSRLLRNNREYIKKYITIEGLEKYIKAKEKGRGVLYLTGHCGNWELMSLTQALRGYPVNIVARPIDNPYLSRRVEEIRTRYGNSIIEKKRAMRGILRCLEEDGTIGILLDQNVIKKEGVFVDFFGEPACTNKGLALIALKTGTPVLPAFIHYLGEGRHRIEIGEEVVLEKSGDPNMDVVSNTAKFTKIIEEHIRKYPEEWLWLHRRWKTRPDS
ncbi:MAG: lysophospholipid acyltransferase family protein [Nitrospirota bacterium]